MKTFLTAALLTLLSAAQAATFAVQAAASDTQGREHTGAASSTAPASASEPQPGDAGAAQGAGTWQPTPAEAETVVARVGDESVRLEDLLDWVRANPQAFSSFGSQWTRNAVLHEVIKRVLLSRAAQEAFADEPDAQELSEKALQARYKSRFLTPSKTVSEEELRQYYDDNKAQFGIPPMVRIRELFFPKPRIGFPDESEAMALEVYGALQDGAEFEDFAADHAPDEASKQAGGDRGFLSTLERPQLGELTAGMAVGAVSEPVELTTGYSIIQLMERRSGVPAPFEAVRDEVERSVIAEREGDLIAEFLSAQASARGVEILLPEYAGAWPEEASAPAANDTDN